MKSACALALIALAAGSPAQTGREFDSIEGLVASSEIMAVGKILACDTPGGDPRRGSALVRFQVSERIRGRIGRTVELRLDSVSAFVDLQTMRDLGADVLLAFGSVRHWYAGYAVNRWDGAIVPGRFAYFRYLDLPSQKNGAPFVPSYLFDNGRIFNLDLEPLAGRRAIVARAKSFHRLYPTAVETSTLVLPNDYLRRVGDPNAYGAVRLPVCPEFRATLLRLLRQPEAVLHYVRTEQRLWERKSLLMMAIRALEPFRDPETRSLAERFAREGDPLSSGLGDGDHPGNDVRGEARRLLEKWAALYQPGPLPSIPATNR